MPSLTRTLKRLESEIETTAVFLRSHGLRKDLYLFDYALALYMQGAVEAADSVLLLARSRHVRRAPMLARFLSETLVDVGYLITRDDAEKEGAAARSLAWVLLENERHYRSVQTAMGPGGQAPTAPETAEEGLERICSALERHEISGSEVRRAFADMCGQKRPPRHWSRHQNAKARIEMAVRAGIPLHGWGRWAPYLYNLFSSASHASPIWEYVTKQNRDRFVDPGLPLELGMDLSESHDDTIGMAEIPLIVLPLLRALASQVGW